MGARTDLGSELRRPVAGGGQHLVERDAVAGAWWGWSEGRSGDRARRSGREVRRVRCCLEIGGRGQALARIFSVISYVGSK
jgi:hypothetical protein